MIFFGCFLFGFHYAVGTESREGKREKGLLIGMGTQPFEDLAPALITIGYKLVSRAAERLVLPRYYSK